MGSVRGHHAQGREVRRIAAQTPGQRIWARTMHYLARRLSTAHEKHYRLFESIEIETINRCNSSCSFCPVNVHADTRTLARMSEETFRKIIDELGALDYHDCIMFHSNNEPFLDKQLVPRIAYARKRRPHAWLSVYTNGTALNPKLFFSALDAGLDQLQIDNYADNLQLHDNVKEIVAALERPENAAYVPKVEILVRRLTEVLSNRAGNAPNKDVITFVDYRKYRDIGCPLPFRQLVIRPTGEVSLCCNDALGQATMGDVTRQSLVEIWSGPAFTELREELQRNGRRNLKLCNTCDVLMPRFEYNLLRDRTRRARRHAANA